MGMSPMIPRNTLAQRVAAIGTPPGAGMQPPGPVAQPVAARPGMPMQGSQVPTRAAMPGQAQPQVQQAPQNNLRARLGMV